MYGPGRRLPGEASGSPARGALYRFPARGALPYTPAVDILALPFRIIGGLLGFLFGLVGAIVLFVIGIVLIVIGGALAATGLGAPIGIGLLAVGVLLCLRAVF